MAKKAKPSRTQVEDLEVSANELTTEKARKVKGGKGTNDPQSENNLPLTKQTRTGQTGTPKRSFGE